MNNHYSFVFQDTEFENGRMNDIPYNCGKFAGSLRKQLFREHLGLIWSGENIKIKDIIKKSFYRDIWRARSKENTEIFEDVFNCIPTNKVVNFTMLKQYQGETPLCIENPEEALKKIKNIKVIIKNADLN